MLGVGHLGLVYLLLQLAQAVPLHGLVGGRLDQLGVAISKRHFTGLGLLLPLLKLLCVRGLVLLKGLQIRLCLAAMLDSRCRLSQRFIAGRPSLSGFLLALCSGGLGLAPGLFGRRIDLEPR